MTFHKDLSRIFSAPPHGEAPFEIRARMRLRVSSREPFDQSAGMARNHSTDGF